MTVAHGGLKFGKYYSMSNENPKGLRTPESFLNPFPQSFGPIIAVRLDIFSLSMKDPYLLSHCQLLCSLCISLSS